MRDIGSGSRAKALAENKRINALNLEPTLQKPSDPVAHAASKAGSRKAADLKEDFKLSLDNIKAQESRKLRGRQAGEESRDTAGSVSAASTSFGVPAAAPGSLQAGNFQPRLGVTNAETLTPFPIAKKSPKLLSQSLQELLEPFYKVCASADVQKEDTRWPNMSRMPYIETLGKPDPSNTLAQQMMGAGVAAQNVQAMAGMQQMQMQGVQPMPGGAAANPQWQQQQPQAPMAPNQPQGAGQQMMQHAGYPQQMQQMYQPPMQMGHQPQMQQQQQLGQMQQQPQALHSSQQQHAQQHSQQQPQQQWVMMQNPQGGNVAGAAGPGGQMPGGQQMMNQGMMMQGMNNQGMMMMMPQGGQQGGQQGQMMMMPMMMGGNGGQQGFMMMPGGQQQNMMMQPMQENG